MNLANVCSIVEFNLSKDYEMCSKESKNLLQLNYKEKKLITKYIHTIKGDEFVTIFFNEHFERELNPYCSNCKRIVVLP